MAKKIKRRLQRFLLNTIALFINSISNIRCVSFIGNFLLCIKCMPATLIVAKRLIVLQKQNHRKNVIGPAPALGTSDIKLSVIIPTYNRAKSLVRCLNSLLAQTMDKNNFEIVVVNNNSPDHTQTVCQQYDSRFIHFKAIIEPQPGLLAARHAGWKHASANILVFCDDDIEAPQEWLQTLASLFAKDPDIQLVGGNNWPVFESNPPAWLDNTLWAEGRGIRWNQYFSLIEGITAGMEAPDPGLVFGCNYAIRRTALEKAGGFEPDLMENALFQGAGETSVAMTIKATGGKIYLHPAASVWHHMPNSRLTLEYMYKRGIHHTIAILYSYLRNENSITLPILPCQQTENPGMKSFYKGQNYAANLYIKSVLNSQELQKWIALDTYFNNESPSKLETYALHYDW